MTASGAFLDRDLCRRLHAGAGDATEKLAAYHLETLGEAVTRARQRTPFYRDRFAGLPQGPFPELSRFQSLPFTFPSHIRDKAFDFLAVSRDEIARIITLQTSGTTAPPKRLFFTDADLEHTLGFFTRVLKQLMAHGETGFILLPGTTPASAGDLLKTAMERIGARGIVQGIITDFNSLAGDFTVHRPAILIGLPIQVLAFSQLLREKDMDAGCVRDVILTSDYLSPGVRERIAGGLGCRVFDHYGLTETGFGGGIDCLAHQGYHLREADFYFEIVDPDTGRPAPDGTWGEIALTTLTRLGMPLVRYRTGDISRILPGPCPCQSPFRRMDTIRGRRGQRLVLPGGLRIGMPDLDDLFFRFPGVMDFSATVTGLPDRPRLDIRLHGSASLSRTAVSRHLAENRRFSPILDQALEDGSLELDCFQGGPFRFTDTYRGKRRITTAP